MTAALIDGKAIAAALRARIAVEVRRLERDAGVVPGLAVVRVGEDPASAVYVRNKGLAAREAGMRAIDHTLPAGVPQAALLDLVAALNADEAVDGILVQLPLPGHIDPAAVIEAITPAKDVDGFHPVNVGRLAAGAPALAPCTPAGCLQLIRTVHPGGIAGAEAVVVGRSGIVGKPMAGLLLGADATVTVAHSRTRDLPAVCRRADVLVVAVGRAELVRGDWIRPGATVIDVGINRVQPSREGSEGARTRLVGDVAFAEAAAVAGAITPVPGGVGPMTIACLLGNTLQAARLRRGLGPAAP